MYYCLLAPTLPWHDRTCHTANRETALAWLDARVFISIPLRLDVYWDPSFDELPTQTITDAAKVYEYLSGGTRCGPLPVPSTTLPSSQPNGSASPSSWRAKSRVWRLYCRLLWHVGTKPAKQWAVKHLEDGSD